LRFGRLLDDQFPKIRNTTAIFVLHRHPSRTGAPSGKTTLVALLEPYGMAPGRVAGSAGAGRGGGRR